MQLVLWLSPLNAYRLEAEKGYSKGIAEALLNGLKAISSLQLSVVNEASSETKMVLTKTRLNSPMS
jgi:hypothetical protein